MSHPVLHLELPDDIYEHVRRAAEGTNQPLEKTLVNIVRGATPSLEKVPPSIGPTLRPWKISAISSCGRLHGLPWRPPNNAAWKAFFIRTSKAS